MSHATVAITPAVQSMLATMMPVVAVGTAAFAVTAGALMAAKKLRCDFESAREEFEQRCRQDEAGMQAEANRQAFKSISASGFAAAISAGSENTTVTFLQGSLADMANRAARAGMEDVRRRAVELAGAVDTADAKETLQAYFALSDQMEAAPQDDLNRGMLEALRSEIESPALAAASQAKVRKQFVGQLEKLEAVGDRNASVVRQGAENLRARVRREIADHADREQLALRERIQKRELVADAYAMLRAVLEGSGDPNECMQANGLLGDLGAAFQKGTPPTLSELEALLAKTRSLFQKCEKRLEEVAAHAYVAESVKDVLIGMGYNVSEVPAEIATRDPGCMVSIDGDSGVVVSVAPDGRMLTEMVAFSQHGVNPDEAAEKKVCAVVDDILAGLRRRDIPMEERSRKKLRPGHKLRVVKKAKTQELAAAATAQRARSIE